MSAARIVVLPLGELEQGGHDYGTCMWCGASAWAEACRVTVYPGTRAQALICEDTIGCSRRRYWNRLRECWGVG